MPWIVSGAEGPILPGEPELRSAVPDFDIFRPLMLTGIEVRSRPEGETTVRLTLVSKERFEVTLMLESVTSLSVPQLGKFPLTLVEMEVLDLRADQMEGVAFHVTDSGTVGFSAYCGALRVVEVARL